MNITIQGWHITSVGLLFVNNHMKITCKFRYKQIKTKFLLCDNQGMHNCNVGMDLWESIIGSATDHMEEIRPPVRGCHLPMLLGESNVNPVSVTVGVNCRASRWYWKSTQSTPPRSLVSGVPTSPRSTVNLMSRCNSQTNQI